MDEIAIGKNDRRTKYQQVKLSSGSNVKLKRSSNWLNMDWTKCRIDKMSNGKNVEGIKYQMNKRSSRQNIEKEKY